jgi:hypothetical protein
MNRPASPPIIGPLNIHGVLALAGMLGPVVLVACDFTAAFSDPGYNLIRDSISSLALTPMGWLQTIGFLAIGLLVEIFTAGLLFNICARWWCHLGIGLLVGVGFGLLIIGAFHTDPVDIAQATTEGTIHGIVAKIVFWLFPIAIVLIALSFRHDPRWKGLFVYTLVTVALALLLILVVGFLPEESGLFGLFERLLAANLVVWVEVTAIQMLRLSLRRERAAEGAEPVAEPGA